jgi:peptidoglycan/LPS O-acetylase OafA/YrhL
MVPAIHADQASAARLAARPATARLPVINGLRGVAIIGVLSFHVMEGMFTRAAFPPALSIPLASGWSGVNLFFILSGFVLFLPYAANEDAIGLLARPLGFYRRRARRLLPLFYCGTLAAWALAVAGGAPAAPGQLLAVLSLGFIFDSHSLTPSFNPALWSLGDEIAFSLIFPLLALSFRRHGACRILFVAAVIALVLRVGGIWRLPALQGATFNSDMFACRFDEFVLGMALAWIYVRDRLPRRPLWFALGGLVAILAAWTGFDLVLREALPPLCRAFLNDLLDAGFAAIVAAALVPRTPLAMALSWPPLQVAGMMCYSLYVWHMPLLDWLAPDRARLPLPQLGAELALYLVATFAVAALSYRFIEFPRTGDWRRYFRLPARVPPLTG